MTALVTGGGGFIGRHLVEALMARGETVRCLARGDYPDLVSSGVHCVRADIGDAGAVDAACEGVDTVYHVAARAGVWGARDLFWRPNVEGTDNVIAACLRNGVARLVFTSSPSVVFDNRAHRGADETTPYPRHFENPYSESKAVSEQRVLAANCERLRTVALRPHLVFGPRDNHLVPRLLERARHGRIVQVGDGANRVDLSYVEDVARAHLLAADSLAGDGRAAGRAYFVSQGEPVALWDWIAGFLAALDLPPVSRQVSLARARRAGAFLEAMHRLLRLPGEPRLTRFVASELALDHHYDIGAAARDFDYRPLTDMATATAATVRWVRESGLV